MIDLSIRASSSDVYKSLFYLAIKTKYYVAVTLGWHDNNPISRNINNKTTRRPLTAEMQFSSSCFPFCGVDYVVLV